MLFDIFEEQPVEDARSEIISILEDLVPHLLNSGDFRSVAFLMSETHVVFGRADMIQEHRRRMAALTMTFSSPGGRRAAPRGSGGGCDRANDR